VGQNHCGWLVVSNMNFIFYDIWDVILTIDEFIFFKMVKTTNHIIIYIPIGSMYGIYANIGDILMINVT